MDKIAVGPAAVELLGTEVRLEHPPERNLAAIAAAEGRPIHDLTAVILERSRHRALIAETRAAGSRVRLIGDGDLSAAILAALPGSGVHVALGVGGAPEGVIAAAALRCLGGGMLGRLLVRTEAEHRRIADTGVRDAGRERSARDLAPGDNLLFCAAGVTDGALVSGVRFTRSGIDTTTLVLGSDPPQRTRIIRRRLHGRG